MGLPHNMKYRGPSKLVLFHFAFAPKNGESKLWCRYSEAVFSSTQKRLHCAWFDCLYMNPYCSHSSQVQSVRLAPALPVLPLSSSRPRCRSSPRDPGVPPPSDSGASSTRSQPVGLPSHSALLPPPGRWLTSAASSRRPPRPPFSHAA